jgi:hypothetical protein
MAKKIIRLTESELISYIKKAINEAPTGLEPVEVWSDGFTIPFKEGGYGNEFSQDQINGWVKKVKYVMEKNMPVIAYLIDNHNLEMELPPIIQYSVGTSSTGGSQLNANLATNREKFIKNIIRKGFEVATGFEGEKLDFEQIQKYITNAKGNYYNTGLSKAFSRLTSKPLPEERESSVILAVYEIKGLTRDRISNVRQGMEDESSGSYLMGLANYLGMDETNPQGVLKQLQRLRTVSDIYDLNQDLENKGGLEVWLNNALEKGGDASHWKERAVDLFNTIAAKSGKPPIVRLYKDDIVFNPGIL